MTPGMSILPAPPPGHVWMSPPPGHPAWHRPGPYPICSPSALGQANPFEAAAEVLIEPLYPALERRMIETVKREIGPFVVGGFLGFMLHYLWFIRATGKRVF